MRILGRNIGIYLASEEENPQIVGLSTSCSIDIQTEMIPVVGGSSFFTSVVPGRNSMTIQVERLISSTSPLSLAKMQVARTRLRFVVEVEGARIVGEAYISSQSANGPSSGYALNSITLTCTGDLAVIDG